MGVYSKILKQAYEIMRQNRYLWLLGLFLSLVNITIIISGTYGDEHDQNISGYFILGVVLFYVFLSIISFRIKAALIIAVKATLDKQGTSINKAISSARFFYWRIFGVSLLIQFSALILLVLFSTPISYMHNQGQVTNAIALGTIGGLILLPILVSLWFINVLAPMFIVIYDQKINEATNKSANLITKQWVPLLWLGSITVLLQAGTLFLSTFMLKLASGMPILGYILEVVVYLILQTFVAVFSQTAWVLLFLNLIKPQKLETEESVVVPEIAS